MNPIQNEEVTRSREATKGMRGTRQRPRLIAERFQLLVTCESEQDQRTLFERFRREGRAVRVLVL